MKTAAIFSQFPRYDETFLLRDLISLRKAGVDIQTYTLKKCTDPKIQPDAEPFGKNTVYIPWFFSGRIFSALFYWLTRKPSVIFRHIFFLLGAAAMHPVQTCKNLAVIPKSLAFARHVKDTDVQIIHAMWATYPASAAKLIAELTGLPWAMSAHAHDVYMVNSQLREKILLADEVFTCTEPNRKHLAKLVPEKKGHIHTVYHGLDTRHFSPSEKTGKGGPFRILAVGSLTPRKGYGLLLKAAAKALQEGLDFRVKIIGDGPLRQHVEQMIKELSLQKQVELAGEVDLKDMPEQYRNTDMLILTAKPGLHFGLPNVVLEAMACGVPSAVTALPSVKGELTDCETALLLPFGTDVEIIDAAKETMKRLAIDPELQKKIGHNGRKLVEEKFSMDNSGRIMKKLYHRAISKYAVKNRQRAAHAE